MMPIKALIISNYRTTIPTRPEAETFIGLKQSGIDIHIMTYPDAEYIKRFTKHGIRVIKYHPHKKFSREAIKRIREELINEGHQILHLFNSRAIINGIFAARGLPVKVVLYRGYTGHINWYDPTAYLKYLNPRVDKIICLARSIEDLFHKQLFFNKNKTIIINKGHAAEWYNEIQPSELTGLNIPSKSFIATCVANARPFKGIPYLIKSTYYIPSGLPIHLLLVGNNMDTAENIRLINKSPNKDQIHLTGYRNDAQNIVAASDAFILASYKGEATTRSVIEAMSLGITPVITDIPGNKGLVLNNINGLVVPARNPEAIAKAILRLYHDPALCKELGEKARHHIVMNFNIKDTISKTKALYEELVTMD